MLTLFAILLVFMLFAAGIIILSCFVSMMPAWFAVVAFFALDGIIIGAIVKKLTKK